VKSGEEELTDDEVLDNFVKRVVKVDGKSYKKTNDLIPFVHVVTKCKKCGTTFLYHAPVIGDKEFLHNVIKGLPVVTRVILKNVRCEDHGECKYLGYIFTSLGRLWDAKEEPGEDFDRYIIMAVTNRSSKGFVFQATSDGNFIEIDKVDGKFTGPMINIFDITHWDTDDPMFG